VFLKVRFAAGIAYTFMSAAFASVMRVSVAEIISAGVTDLKSISPFLEVMSGFVVCAKETEVVIMQARSSANVLTLGLSFSRIV